MIADNIRRISVFGTGMMGPGIALLFARAGYRTKLWGPTSEDLSSGEAHFRRCLEELMIVTVIS